MDKVVVELSELKRAVVRISPSDISQSLFSVPFEKVPIDYISDNQIVGEKEKKKKKKGKPGDSSKRAKKTKGGAGPPKRLKEMNSPEPAEIKNRESNKISKNKIIAAKSSLSSNTQVGTPPVAPHAPQKNGFVTLEALKPPPPPPKPPVRINGSSASARSEIISELKDMFVKRGLVTR